MGVYDEFLVGAIDLHCHIDLELSQSAFRKREPEWAWLPKAEALGMRGVVLKSHWWPTVTAVPYLQQLYRGPVQVWSSVTLNPVVGGMELYVAEAAAAMGARMLFLPTWAARNDLEGEGFHTRLGQVFGTFDPRRLQGSTILDGQVRLTDTARELLRFCHEHDLTLGTGHVSWQESLALAEEARAIGYKRLVFTHPLSAVIRAPLEAVQRAAELGAWIEVCWTYIAPGRMDPAAVVQWMRKVGIGQVVVSTDYFRAATPDPPELLRFVLGTLHEAGLTPDEVRLVAAVNPARALGLEPPEGPTL